MNEQIPWLITYAAMVVMCIVLGIRMSKLRIELDDAYEHIDYLEEKLYEAGHKQANGYYYDA